MKIVLFSLFCLILIGMISYSYAQFTDVSGNTKLQLPEVMLQMELRDSNGSLVAYIETEQIIGISPLELNKFLDIRNQSTTEFFIKDDKKYEFQQFKTTTTSGTFDEKIAYSSSRLLLPVQEEVLTLLQMRHDSYQTQPGDTIKNFWTIIRPAS